MPRYLLFPVNDALPKHKYFIRTPDGKTVSDFDAAYDPETPRFTAYIDVERFGECAIADEDGKILPTAAADCLPALNEIPGGSVSRPAVHFTTKLGWTNDPNGLVYADGVYHMPFRDVV